MRFIDLFDCVYRSAFVSCILVSESSSSSPSRTPEKLNSHIINHPRPLSLSLSDFPQYKTPPISPPWIRREGAREGDGVDL